jgi:hypothetical protein
MMVQLYEKEERKWDCEQTNGCSKRVGPRDEKNILRVEKIVRKIFREHSNLQTLLWETQISLT